MIQMSPNIATATEAVTVRWWPATMIIAPGNGFIWAARSLRKRLARKRSGIARSVDRSLDRRLGERVRLEGVEVVEIDQGNVENAHA